MCSYWKANKATENAIRQAASHWRDVITPEAERLRIEVGADAVLFQNGFFSSRVYGFEFKSQPDAKLFVKIKGTTNYWRPRANTPIDKRMRKLESNWVGEVKKILGVGGQLQTMGVEVLDYCVLVEWIFDKPPVGCRRISDITYQKLKGGDLCQLETKATFGRTR